MQSPAAVHPSFVSDDVTQVADAPTPARQSPYLRRTRVLRPRPKRSFPLLVGVMLVAALLFGRVWQVTAAHSLAMERDQLRRDVRALENKIRLSSDLTVQEALQSGLDYAALARQGFRSPGPDALVEVDLAQPFPRVVSRQGAMARLSADVGRFVRGILAPGTDPRTQKKNPALPEPASDEVNVVTVSAEDAP
ncbi:MAG TPA: hypothetical protein VGQ14_01835 [Candidatus Eisenbacteria bacterium]|jgi:hypothetical protein|nr:hypothetical protein [Candidatus Eisenbacteria bacterium]